MKSEFIVNETISSLNDISTLINQDFFSQAYTNNPVLNASAIISYVFGYIGVAGFILVIWYERSGKAGPHRTLVNRLVSYTLDQFLLLYLLGAGPDMMRALIGPLPPWLCKLNQLTKNHVHIACSMLAMTISGTKYVFICIYKSVPSVDDEFIATFTYLAVNLIAAVCTYATLMLPGRPALNMLVCTGTYYDEWLDEEKAVSIPTIISLACALCHCFFVTKTHWQSKNMTFVVPFNHQNSEVTNFGTKFMSTCMTFLIIIFMVIFLVYNRYDFLLIFPC